MITAGDYSQVRVEFRVGGQVGVQLVRMIENPLGSGWARAGAISKGGRQ